MSTDFFLEPNLKPFAKPEPTLDATFAAPDVPVLRVLRAAPPTVPPTAPPISAAPETNFNGALETRFNVSDIEKASSIPGLTYCG
ncbi:unnamed protein product [[Candida] boidinii]|nr:unnamed protein product [[Candida] boidinii]